jgi:hypothetical protein
MSPNAHVWLRVWLRKRHSRVPTICVRFGGEFSKPCCMSSMPHGCVSIISLVNAQVDHGNARAICGVLRTAAGFLHCVLISIGRSKRQASFAPHRGARGATRTAVGLMHHMDVRIQRCQVHSSSSLLERDSCMRPPLCRLRLLLDPSSARLQRRPLPHRAAEPEALFPSDP